MDTVTPTPRRGTAGGGRRRWDAGVRAGVISAVAGALALIVALLAWLLPQAPGGGETPGAGQARGGSSETPAGSETRGGPGGGTAASPTYLDSAAFRPESGAADLVEVPRAIKGKAGYTGHEIAVRCPSNETGDLTTDVTYSLLGRYVQFEATVHPYLPAGSNQQAATYVTAMIGIRRTDGSLDTSIAGTQKRASPTAPATLSAAIDNAEKLTLRIECGNPNGIVVLTAARLTPAAG